MIISILDFTIPGSCCNLFYEDKNRNWLTKSYQKPEGKDSCYYINGNVYKNKNYVFKKFNKKKFDENKEMLYLDK